MTGALAMELVQNVRAPTVREQFRAQTIQRLHNYVAGTATLIDHSRRLMKGRSGTIVSEFETMKTSLEQNPEVPFVKDLRNFTLHRELPGLGHTVQFADLNSSDASMSSEVDLSVEQLLAWTEWKPASRAFIERHEDKIALRPVVTRHGELIRDANVWLLRELVAANADALSEVNRLSVERAAIFFGTDVATAEQMIRDRKLQLAAEDDVLSDENRLAP